jgi:hypothetical protein
VATSRTSVSSSSKVNSSVSIKPTERKRNTIEELDEIMENIDLEESSGYSNEASELNFDNISNYGKDFTARHGDVSYNSEDTWRSGLELYDNEQIIFSSGSNQGTSNRHQVFVIISDTSE